MQQGDGIESEIEAKEEPSKYIYADINRLG